MMCSRVSPSKSWPHVAPHPNVEGNTHKKSDAMNDMRKTDVVCSVMNQEIILRIRYATVILYDVYVSFLQNSHDFEGHLSRHG